MIDERISPREALQRGYGPVIDGQILKVDERVQAIGIITRLSHNAAEPTARAALLERARELLRDLRGLVALNPYIEIQNLDLLDDQLSAIQARAFVIPETPQAPR